MLKGSKSRQYPLRDTPDLMRILLKDRTTKKNIKWATDDYADFGFNVTPKTEIDIRWLTNDLRNIVQPRVKKNLETQKERTKEKAEVFTPTWIVEKQVNYVDDEFKDLPLENYISKTWLEITCGEAPYICTRYDSTTGEPLSLEHRVGFLDKKLNRISKEINDRDTWLKLVKIAYETTYGYEYQGDSLIIARENLLFTFIDYYIDKFGEEPSMIDLKTFATIISYNLFQMDGLKYTTPFSEKVVMEKEIQMNLFNDLDLNENNNSKNTEETTKFKFANNKLIDFKEMLKAGNNMKFDVVIGNPPYQENDNGIRDDGSINASAKPIYHLFVNESKNISKIQTLIIPGRWLFGAGKGLASFSSSMLESKNIKHLSYYSNSREIFPNNDIKGGICFYIRDNTYYGEAIVNIIKDGNLNTSSRYLDEANINVFIPYKELSTILSKVMAAENLLVNNMQDIVSTLKPFGLRTDFINNPKKYNLPNIQNDKIRNDDIKVIGLLRGERVEKYIPSNYPLNKGRNLIDKYKVMFSYAYGSGEYGEKTSEMIVSKKREICTETFLTIGNFDEEICANNLMKYIKTKFFRALIGVLKTTQHSTTTFRFVPIQDFSKNSDIDWSRSIIEIDQQLYNKYGLSKEEIEFIETNVKEME